MYIVYVHIDKASFQTVLVAICPGLPELGYSATARESTGEAVKLRGGVVGLKLGLLTTKNG